MCARRKDSFFRRNCRKTREKRIFTVLDTYGESIYDILIEKTKRPLYGGRRADCEEGAVVLMKKLGIIFGGKSEEHEISRMSAVSVMDAVDRSKYEIVPIGITKDGRWYLYDGPTEKILTGEWEAEAVRALAENPEKYAFSVVGAGGKTLGDVIDFALPVVHGTYCEDGKLQGLLEMAGIPYGGCGVTASAAAMDKIIAKELFIRAGIPVCPYVAVTAEQLQRDPEGVAAKIGEELGYPVYVKPANQGSSVGISKVEKSGDLPGALRYAACFDRRLLVEKGLSCREIETAVLGNGDDVSAAVTGEIVATEDFYDYDAKYVDDGKPKMQIPAHISEEMSERIREYAVRGFQMLGGEGFARCDFFVDRADGKIYLNEINTIPGFTSFSMFPLLWEHAGSAYSDTIERIIELGYERYYAENHRQADRQKR